MHTNMMPYNIESGILEILTFASDSKGGNVLVTIEGQKYSSGKWKNYHISCSHAICDMRDIEPKSYVSKYYISKSYKQTYDGTTTNIQIWKDQKKKNELHEPMNGTKVIKIKWAKRISFRTLK